MDRSHLTYLREWLTSTTRKPLVMRGARQVGKTWLTRYFAQSQKKHLIEINLERQPEFASLLSSNDPKQILLNLEVAFNREIDPKQSLLFLDEIQSFPELISKLRWFAEDLPSLPVIAAGSLLDFVLAEHSFSMPVGRITYLHLEPLSFEEFLLASDKKILKEYIENYSIEKAIPLAIHQQLTKLFKEYLLVGGLPAAIFSWVSERSLLKVNQIQHDLIATYRDDFSKYKGRLTIEKMDEVMMAIPKMLGQKFIYSRVNPLLNINTVKQALYLLRKARLCHPVMNCSANGIPLSAEINEKIFKEVFLDVGLSCAALGLSFNQINTIHEVVLINKGAVAEQVVGQILRTLFPPYQEPALYYWHREVKGSSSEVDYVIQCGSHIIPLEVKAGSTGSLKSLHLLMGLKNFPLALRINSDPANRTKIKVTDQTAKKVEYTLLSLPFYLLSQVFRLIGKELYGAR